MWPPQLLRYTARILRGKSSTSLWQKAGVISSHACSTLTFKSLKFVGFLCFTFHCITLQTFSIGFRSGLLPGHWSSWISFSANHAQAVLETWHGAESCWNVLQPCNAMKRFNFSLTIFKYFSVFILTPASRNVKAPRPWWLKHPHTMTEGGCLMVADVNRGLKGDVPIGRLTNRLGAWLIHTINISYHTDFYHSSDYMQDIWVKVKRSLKKWSVPILLHDTVGTQS